MKLLRAYPPPQYNTPPLKPLNGLGLHAKIDWQQVTATLLALAAVDAIKAEQGLEKLSQAVKDHPGWTAVFIIAGVAAVALACARRRRPPPRGPP